MPLPSRLGRFQIVRELGKGSQGVVYLASDPRLERQVAIKTLHRHLSQKGVNQERLMREARTVSKLQHPNIIPLFEAGEQEDLLYLVFEYVDGISIRDHIKRNGPFIVHSAITHMTQILDGIARAHEQGIVHRDLSPSNILIDKNGMPRIMDFGISVMIGTQKKPEKGIAGTPYYMSPEHFSEGSICTQSDIFSLGLIFYEMLIASPAIEADNEFTIMYKIANETIEPPSLKNPTIDKKLDVIILKALEKGLDSRYGSAVEMKKDLNAYLEDEGVEAEKISQKETHSTLDFLLRRIRHKSDFPTFSAHIVEINKKASISRVNYASASELANAVLKDYSLTNKLLKLVNSAFYGQFAGKITTISRAVVVLGFEQVAMAASSLMLFDQLKSKGQRAELKDSAVSSLMSGMIAKDLADRVGFQETEEAFICAMFHNLGKHLVLFYFPEECNQIKNLMAQKGITEKAAVRSILGISYEDLAIGIAKTWRFPVKIINSMASLPKGKLDKPKSEGEMLRNLSGFSNELCTIISTGEKEESEEAVTSLLNRFKDSFPVPKKQISSLLDSATEKVEEFSGIYNVNLKQSNFLKQVDEYSKTQKEEVSAPVRDVEVSQEAREIDQDVEVSQEAREIDQVVEAGQEAREIDQDVEAGREAQEIDQDDHEELEIKEAPPPPVEQQDSQSILINGIQDITNTLLEDFELNDVLTMILETIYRGFGFNRVLFCIMNTNSGVMDGRFGFGRDIEKISKNFSFEVKKASDVFSLAVLQAKDIGIDDVYSPRIKRRIPDWYVKIISAPAFVLYPIVVDKVPLGLIYADSEKAGKMISGNQSNYMKTLCNQAILAIKQMKQKR